ncbi:hypothetical protein SDC9_180396 [bioreactor metagenome]|uniref:Uncharacterized protein n=1 Tax=bioreactor metagenome TaxID=1076179 RepID=A0A645HAU0_9ZZZZ
MFHLLTSLLSYLTSQIMDDKSLTLKAQFGKIRINCQTLGITLLLQLSHIGIFMLSSVGNFEHIIHMGGEKCGKCDNHIYRIYKK